MSDSQQNPIEELVEQGAAALKSGNIAEAYSLLREAVQREPDNERAWLWLAGAVPGDDQRRFCLERVLQINPTNTAAKRGLSALPAANTQPRSEALAVPPMPVTPPVPTGATSAAASQRSNQLFDPLAQPMPVTPPAKPAVPELPRWDIPTPQQAPVVEPGASVQASLDEIKPSNNSLELLQREQQQQEMAPGAGPNTTTRPSFVKPRLGKEKEAKSDPKTGAKLEAASPAGAAIRPEIPVVPHKRRADRGFVTLLGLGVVLLLVLGLIGYLISSELDRRNQQAAIPTVITEVATREVVATNVAEPTVALDSTATPDPAPLLAQARTLAESGNHEQAIVTYTKVLSVTESADAYFERGNSYFKLNDFKAAASDFGATVRLRPTDVTAQENLARSFLRANEFERAIEAYTKALALNPNEPVSYLRRGIAYERVDKSDLALADYNSAIRLKPDYLEAFVNRGDAHRAKGDYEGAIVDYNAALKLKPDSTIALLGRGNTEIDAKRFRAGVEDCNRVAKISADIPEPYFCRGRAYAGLKQYQQALDDFGRSLELNPDQPDVLRERARTQLLLGDKVAAKADFEQAASLYEQFGDTDNLAIVRAELEKLK